MEFLMEEIEFKGWGIQVRILSERNKKNFLELSNGQSSDAGNTNRHFSHGSILYKSFDADPDGRGRDCSFVEIWVWITRKIKMRFSLDFLDYQDSNEK